MNKPDNVKIIQIAAVVENSHWGREGEHCTPHEEATIYGLGDDGNAYWLDAKITRTQVPCEEDGPHDGSHDLCSDGKRTVKSSVPVWKLLNHY